MTTLTLEQKFNLQAFKRDVEKLNEEEAKTLLAELYETMLVKEALYKGFIRYNWGLEPSTVIIPDSMD
jgi:hypothetical protein